jgi:predicted SprT family Zn-dependent metalloprotease
MERIKCITFDKNAQDNLPEHIKAKMKADREAVQNGGKTYKCINCQTTNVLKRKPIKPVSKDIVGYCKNCGHVIWE